MFAVLGILFGVLGAIFFSLGDLLGVQLIVGLLGVFFDVIGISLVYFITIFFCRFVFIFFE